MNESLYGSPENPENKFINLKLKFKQLDDTEIIIDNNKYFNLFSDNFCTVSGYFDNYIFKLYSETILYNKIINEETKYKDIQYEPKRYSKSSNVELPVYINIKRFIEEKEISFLGLYLLCKKAIEKGFVPNFKETKRPVVFFQSIVGSYLASVFAKIACLDIAYLDHIGPKNKIYRTIRKNTFEKQSNYLLISDVICMGTEIQTAKSIITHEGAEVTGILSIVDVKVIDEAHNYQELNNENKKIEMCSLFTLTNNNNGEINYQIKTNF